MARLREFGPGLRANRPVLAGIQTHDGPDRDLARRISAPWRRLYATPRWKALRLRVIERDCCTCRMCARIEADTARLVADHVVPHRGDPTLFWDPDNLQCLCAACHSGQKQRQERELAG